MLNRIAAFATLFAGLFAGRNDPPPPPPPDPSVPASARPFRPRGGCPRRRTYVLPALGHGVTYATRSHYGGLASDERACAARAAEKRTRKNAKRVRDGLASRTGQILACLAIENADLADRGVLTSYSAGVIESRRLGYGL